MCRMAPWMITWQGGGGSFLTAKEDDGFLPFICCLDNKEQVHDPENWPMANPSLPYLPDLQAEIREEYKEWIEHPGSRM